MTSVFSINFRREAWQREVARSRARVISLGVWLSYFGALAVIFGLYALNFVTLVQRTRMVERQGAMQHRGSDTEIDWSKQTAELGQIERGLIEPQRWHERLERLSVALPVNARLTAIEFDPGGTVGGSDWNKLVLSGVLKAEPDQDRMRGVSDLVSRLKGDSLLAANFRSIRLAATRITETSGSSAEFVIECRP